MADLLKASPVVHGLGSVWAMVPEWLQACYEKGEVLFLSDGVEVKTSEGWSKALASKGDWVYMTTNGLTTSAQQALAPETWYRKTFCKEQVQ